MKKRFQFTDVARLPLPDDNVAIVTRRLEVGDQIDFRAETVTLAYTILEGHRFAVQPIATGEALLSWGLPFGRASRDIPVGAYVCNAGMLEALAGRSIDFNLPAQPNFVDEITPYQLDAATFKPAAQLPLHETQPTFMGFNRGQKRGVGTRNYIVLLGTTSRTGSYVKQLEARLQGVTAASPNLDGIVAVAHTEGDAGPPHNLELLLRTLAGWLVHPNVGAVLAVDYGVEAVTNEMLRRYMLENGYPLDRVTHTFLSLSGSFAASLAQGEAIVRGWLEPVNRMQRTEQPLSQLKIALQCGGSDAFSGISGNPLASWVAREIIRYGGAANLAETDELIGAESYVLQKVKDVATAQKFLATVERFKERVAWHGTSAEGNPSGGNKYRGLYNIVLKSIGAAMKRHPDTRLDAVIDYGELMRQPGYYFMDSPGNDLESIAGQVASGCNMIIFVTGNGSITNFPFVPTLKIVTTTARYDLLSHEMDVNAGAYLDGTPMDELGQGMLDLTVAVASGQLSVGEKAGHAQAQIWRDWPQTDDSHLAELLTAAPPDGRAISIAVVGRPSPQPSSEETASRPTGRGSLSSLPLGGIEGGLPPTFPALRTSTGLATDQVGLILPTSLCAGQVARMTAEVLNRQGLGRDRGLSRFVSLVHTEGCGVSGGPGEEIYVRTLLGYLTHPLVKHCLLLEHGCEKTHNDYMRHRLQTVGLDPARFGWASIQLDGGIEAVMEKIEGWFAAQLAGAGPPQVAPAGLAHLRLGLLSAETLPAEAAAGLAELTKMVVGAGGTVVVPDNGGLLPTPAYREALLSGPVRPSLAYGQRFEPPGFHVMETPSPHWAETLTGLAATGIEVLVAHVGRLPRQSHPLVPVLQLGQAGDDLDLVLSGDPAAWSGQVLQLILDVAGRGYIPKLHQQGNLDFQITRGLLGVSL